MTPPSPVEVLTQARALLEKGWCQGANARNSYGDVVLGPAYEDADKYCVVGALLAQRRPSYCVEHELICEEIGSDDIAEWNDAPGRTQEEVLALMDRALDLARQKEAGGDVL